MATRMYQPPRGGGGGFKTRAGTGGRTSRLLVSTAGMDAHDGQFAQVP